MEKKTERSIRRLFIDGAADLGDAIQCLEYKKDGLEIECQKAVEVIIDELGVPEHGTSPVSAIPESYGAATREEPTPDGDGADVARLVQEDIEKRAEEGRREYGERLTTGNGRNALVDAYQEALDLCMYLRQQIEEQAAP